MAKHEVICAVCNQKFDLNTVQGVKFSSRRYAHQKCHPTGEIVPLVFKKPHEAVVPEEEKDDYHKLCDYIAQLFGDTVNWGMVGRQLKMYRENFNYTYSGMLKSLKYACEIQTGDVKKAEGVGIIPFYYRKAYDYYYSIWEAQQKNVNKVVVVPVDREIHITPPERKERKRPLFTFLDEEEES